jgi:hypothetical protein
VVFSAVLLELPLQDMVAAVVVVLVAEVIVVVSLEVLAVLVHLVL